MSSEYKPNEIESKWQKYWEKSQFFKAEDFSRKSKKYILIEFPYPSGDGLHVGHVRSYAALDAVARKARMEGFNVLFPIGWDAFGLPTENYAIKTGVHPEVATKKNIANFKRQLKMLGISFDWSREINTTDPEYYRWTQWIFLKLFEKGLAYQAKIPINWCPSCKIGLANEEVVGGKCERCGAEAEKKVLKQWMIKITAYADRLIDDLEKVDYPERVKAQQINWIGRSVGTEIDFRVPASAKATAGKENSEDIIRVFTTRTDTLFGVTAIVLAPENHLIEKLTTEKHKAEVEKYIKEARKKNDFEREKLEKEKTGVFTGSYCINPANNEKVPIWIGDYVIATYGGGAVMMVPAHDFRDFDFAKRYNLPIREVIAPYINTDKNTDLHRLEEDAFVDYGKLINSGEFDGLSSEEAIKKITESLEKKNLGRKTIQYKLRDWVFSRQHYWGEPIPLVFCENCAVKIKNQKSKIKNNEFSEGELLNPGWIAVSEKDLPVELPHVEKYQPTGTGESPLSTISEWVNVKCPKCKGPAKRETDTMPNWAGSNWYYLAYLMRGISNFQSAPHRARGSGAGFPISKYKKVFKYWMPVDWYNGGMEHTTLHLLYSRFIYKFLFDIGVAPHPEPYQKRTSHGMVLAEDGRKMSKSFGNIINPDDIVKKYGADTLRVYEMFMGPFDQAIAWNTNGVEGAYRFLNKLWDFVIGQTDKSKTDGDSLTKINKTIKKISEDIENFKFNTAISSLMELLNFFRGEEFQSKKRGIGKEDLKKILIIIYPFAPHIAEELWEKSGCKKSISFEKWPKADPKFLEEETFELVIQINGKMRDKIKVLMNISEEEARGLTLEREIVKKRRQGKEVKKIIFVKNKLINIVV